MKKNYRLIRSEAVEELHGEASLYEHAATGARVFTVKNHDKNKVFMIGFRTPPDDSTGVAHIMEHSVLCGSEKYPLKDPFVELAKGSLNTFLNAMTFPDKTVYPIASVNDRDFMNLMDVYLDSVFHPNVYREPRIFRQEGWHYEIEDLAGPGETISYNGVVYNEMKGAFSNPDSVLERYTLKALFPDTPYANESGGDPEVIPELTPEAFLEFHSRYYHPSNSYIYLYGDMDMDEKLDWIDENYLKDYGRLEVDSAIARQEPFASPRQLEKYYAVSDNEEEAGHTYLSENFCIADAPTNESNIAWQVLDFILLSSPGALLKEALINAGIGDDISGGYCGEVSQPYFSVIAKNTDPEKTEDFKRIIRDTLTDICEKGISRKSLRAALNYIEFKLREEDYGTFPGGLAAGLNIMTSWLYDRDPYEYVYYNEALRSLKEKAEGNYFEETIRRNLLDNSFSAVVNIIPRKGLTRQMDEALKEELEAYRRSLTTEEKEELARAMEDLKAYQSEADTPEVLAMLPVLDVSDIDRKVEPRHTEQVGDIIWTRAETGGIAYIKVMFSTDGFTEDELQFASFLKDVLGEMDTAGHSYQDLFDEVLLNTGGIYFKLLPMTCRDEPGGEAKYRGFCMADIRVMEDKISEGLGLVLEMINDTRLDDPERIMQLLYQNRSQQRLAIESAMQRAAIARAGSYFSDAQRFGDLTGGVAYYDFLDAAVKLGKQPVHMKRFIKSLKKVSSRLFREDRISFALYGSHEALEAARAELPGVRKAIMERTAAAAAEEAAARKAKGFPEESGPDTGTETGGCTAIPGRTVSSISCMNEGFKTSSQVSYTARCGNFAEKGLKYTGALQVLRVMLNYEYLWINLRVLGGAYGCMSAFMRNGYTYMASFRDPHIRNTNDVYRALPGWLENWDGDEDTVRKYIIGAISNMDMPTTNSIKASSRLSDYMYRLTEEERQRERDELLDCTPEDIRGFAAYIRALLDMEAICTIGNAEKIENDKELFKTVRELF